MKHERCLLTLFIYLFIYLFVNSSVISPISLRGHEGKTELKTKDGMNLSRGVVCEAALVRCSFFLLHLPAFFPPPHTRTPPQPPNTHTPPPPSLTPQSTNRNYYIFLYCKYFLLLRLMLIPREL